MSQSEQYRDDVYLAEAYHAESLRGKVGAHIDGPRGPGDRETYREPVGREPLARDTMREPLGREPVGREAVGRAMGSPLPAGNPLHTGTGQSPAESHAHRTTQPPGRALTGATSSSASEDASSMQRAMGILKQAAPFVARLLPLIDGNFATALGNLFSPRPLVQAAPVNVDLSPVQNQISELQSQQSELRTVVQEQTTCIKRVEDQLEMVREATDRNTLEQQELMEDLKAMGHKVSLVAVGLSVLLVLSVIMNLVLYLYMKRVLP